MALPGVSPAELARRIQITYPGGPLDAQLENVIDVAVSMLAGQQVQELAVTAAPAVWEEAVTQTAVKIWDSGSKGLSGMDAVGKFTFPAPSASAGILDATKGLWSLLTLTGGNVVA